MSEFKKRLAQMEEAWGNREQPAGPPDGIYKMQLQECTIQESQASGKLMIHREHLVVEGDSKGEVLHDYLVLESDGGPRRVKLFIEQMGFECPEDISDLEEVVEAIRNAAPLYLAQIKTSGEFRNVRVKELLEEQTTRSSKPKSKPEPVGEVSGDAEEEAPAARVSKSKPEPAVAPAVSKKKTPAVSKGDDITPLIAFATEAGVDGLTADMEKDAVVATMEEYVWEAKNLEEEQVALLQKFGVTVAGVKKGK